MSETDIIARVYAEGPSARRTRKEGLKHSAAYVFPCPSDDLDRSVREQTELPESPGDASNNYAECVELRFSNPPRSREGFIFGWAPDSDVVLPKRKGISYRHFAMTFDDHNRPIVKDHGSLSGTQITYSKQGQGFRKGFQWIVGGDDFLYHDPENKPYDIVVSLKAGILIQLRLVVTRHDMLSPAYLSNVDRFRQGAASAEELFSHFHFPDHPDTERATGTHTPGNGAIHLRQHLGSGTFATVTRWWNVSTADEFAVKEPSVKAIRERRFSRQEWDNEAHIMGLLEHDHIVKLTRPELPTTLPTHPRLCLEYVPGGSLAEYQDLMPLECLSVLRQLLSALSYLHGSNPPVVHRDIKSENVLVQWRGYEDIFVKFGDFGLSRDYDNLSTICGTYTHLAPEVYENMHAKSSGSKGRLSYTAAVDVWSLGVMVYGFLCPLPKWKAAYELSGTKWAQKVVSVFNKDYQTRPDDFRQFLLTAMVVMSPRERWSARDCHETAQNLSTPGVGRGGTPSRASLVDGEEQATVRYGADATIGEAEEAQTVLWRPLAADEAAMLSGAHQFHRSDASSPRSFAAPNLTATQHTTSASVSRSVGRYKGKTPASYAAGYGATISHVSSEGQGKGEQETLRILPHEQYLSQYNDQISGYSFPAHADRRSDSLAEDSDDSYEARRNVRPNDPQADTAGKRTKRASKPASSSSGRRTKRRTSTSSQRPETFRTVLQDSQRFNTFVAQTAQGWAPGWDDPGYYPGESAELFDPGNRSEWPGSGSEEFSALVEVAPAADGRLENEAAEQQVPPADDLSLPAECDPADSHQGVLSHLSTRSVRCGDSDTRYIVIHRQRVSMRMSDYYLNATDICAAAGLNKSERSRYRRLLQKRGVLDRESSWVPFQDGVFLSEAVYLIDDLKPLFVHAPIDLPEQGNYLLQGWTQLPPGYEFLEYGGISIAYMPSAKVVNAAHLLRLATRRHNLRGFLSRNPQVRAEIHGGPRNIKGTYISFEDAVLLCQHFDLNSSPIDQLLGVSEPVIIEHNRHGEVRNTDDDQEAFEGSPNLPQQCISADDGDVYSSAADGHWPSPPTSRRHSVRYQSASSCHPESQSDTEYDDNCWLDPLHQLGGGSSLAKWGQPRGDPSRITQSFTPLDWMGAESDVPRTDPPQCSPAGGEDLRSPADGSESANDANVDRPADLPVHQQSITPLVGEQEECLQSSGEAALVGPARVDPPTAFRARKKTSPEDQAFLKAEYHRNSKPSKRSYHRIVQTVSMNEKQVQIWFQNRRQQDRKRMDEARY